MLALRTMAGVALKVDVNDAMSFLDEFDYVLHVVGLYDGNQLCVEH